MQATTATPPKTPPRSRLLGLAFSRNGGAMPTLLLTITCGLILIPQTFATPKATSLPLKDVKSSGTPSLVIVLIVDQLRSDTLTRLAHRMIPSQANFQFNTDTRIKRPAANKLGQRQVGGYRFFMDYGAYYPFTEYRLLQAMTGPGHATLASGSYPVSHGIGVNNWWTSGSKGATYCVSDPSSPEFGKSGKGVSPKNFLGSTLGDELKLAHPKSVVASLALKDRAAILMGGHAADLVLWLEKGRLAWTTSKYYASQSTHRAGLYPDLPVGSDGAKKAQRGETESSPSPVARENGLPDWLIKRNQHLATLPQAKQAETNYSEFLRQIFAVETTFDAALETVEQLKMGQDSVPDLLWISLSSHDYMGHNFGPNTPQLDEFTLLEDRAISRFLTHLDTKLPGGLSRVVFALSADHGAPPLAENAKANRMPSGRLSEDEIQKSAERYLSEHTGVAKSIAVFEDANLYFSDEVLSRLKSQETTLELERGLGAHLLKEFPQLAEVLAKGDLLNHRLPLGSLRKYVENGIAIARAGNLILIPKPFFYLQGGFSGVDHHTHYSYDRTVPLIIGGLGFKRGIHAEPAEAVDLAPTLSWRLGILPPALTSGRVLSEAIDAEKIRF